MENPDSSQLFPLILQMEQAGLVTRTFRRLDPERQWMVILAILEEAGDKGPADLNIKQVAARAGMSVGSLYQYFGDRTGLLRFTVELVVSVAVGQFEMYREYLAAMPLRDALAAYLQGGLEWTREQLGFARFFAAAAYQGDPQLAESVVRPIASQMRRMVADMLTAAQARGELRADVDLEALTRVIHVIFIALGDGQLMPALQAYYQLTDETCSGERVAAAALDLVLSGMAAGGGQA